jgi:glycosyltransferase involved in cell wall biosynthesis
VRVLIVSKALVSRAYRQKLSEISRRGAEVVAVVPRAWREGEDLQELEPGDDDGHRLIPIDLRWNGHFHLHYYPGLASTMRSVRPDIVHLDEEPYNLATFLGARAARQAGIPSVFYTYQNIVRPYPPPFSVMERSVYRWVKAAMAAGEEAAKGLRHKGFTKPVTIVPQFGVDPRYFRPRPRPPGPFTVGFPNRLVAGKAPYLALQALSLLPPDIHLHVVGDGPLRPQIEAEVARLRLSSRVVLSRRVPSIEVPQLMAGMDAVILPSISTPRWKEQFGRVLIEAMSCEVAVVGSDSGEIPQVVGDAGLIVPEGNAEALAQAIERLYQNSELRATLGKRGRQRVLEHYTHARVAELTCLAYAEALGDP